MTDILKIARECGGTVTQFNDIFYSASFGEASLPAFVERIRAETREECAKWCEEAAKQWARDANDHYAKNPTRTGANVAAAWGHAAQTLADAAAAIRSAPPVAAREAGEKP